MNEEYLTGDNELFEMLARKKPTGRQTVGVVVPISRVQELEALEKKLRWVLIMKPVIGFALTAALFFAASILGWMDMVFGSILTLAAASRAITLYWRYRHGRK